MPKMRLADKEVSFSPLLIMSLRSFSLIDIFAMRFLTLGGFIFSYRFYVEQFPYRGPLLARPPSENPLLMLT